MSLKPLNSPGGFSVGEITTGAINVISSTGNVTTGNIIGSAGGNLNIVANNLLINGGNGVGNLSVGNLLASGNVQGTFILGNIRYATGGYDDANVEAYLPTYTGGFENLTGDVYTTANITGQYILGNGYYLTDINAGNIVGSYGNADVANYLASGANVLIDTLGNITTTANIAGGYLLGNGYFITGIQYGNIAGANANIKAYLESGQTINANFGGGTLYALGNANLGPTIVNGNLQVAGNISATGNITYISVQDLVIDDPLIYLAANNPGDTEDIGIVGSYNDGTYAHTGFVRDHIDDTWKVFQGVTSEPNTVIAWNEAVYAAFKAGPILSNATITANANVVATGNVSGTYLLGNGYFITGIQYSNINGAYGNSNVADYLPTYTGNLASLTGNVVTTANISAAYVAGTLTTAAQPNVTSLGTLNSLIVGATVLADGYSARTGGDLPIEVLGVNASIRIIPNGTGITDFANKPIGNIGSASVTGNITASGNISGTYLLGNGAFITGLPAGYSNADVANYLPTYTGNLGAGNLNLTGNIIDTGPLQIVTGSGNIGLAPANSNVLVVSTTGIDVTGAVTATGNISTTGNITAGNYLGSGANTTIAAGSYNWQFQDNGNITLAGNSFSVNYANGQQVSLGGTYSNSDVQSYLASNANVVILTTGNITTSANAVASYFIGDGSLLSNINAGNITGSYGNAQVAAYLQVYNGNASFNHVNANSISCVANITAGNISAALLTGTLTTAAQPNITTVGTLVSLDVAANITAGGLQMSTANATIGNLYVTGNTTIAGNIQQISGNSGQFFGNAATGFNALYAGLPAGFTLLPQSVMNFVSSYNGYSQVNNQNQNGGDEATVDYVLTGNNGDDENYYFDIGYTSSGFDGTVAGANNAIGTAAETNDAYMYTTANVAAGQIGNLILATVDTNSQIRFVVGGRDMGNTAVRINSPNTVSANSTSGTITVQGDAGINGNINASGYISATGNITSSGNISGTYLLGNGAFITGLPAGYSNADVANYLNSAPNINITLGNSNSNITTGGTIRTYGNAIANNFVANSTVTIQSSATQAVVFDAINQTTSSASLTTLATIDVTTLPADSSVLEVTLRGKDGTNTQAGKIMIAWGGSNMDYTRYAEVLVGAGCGTPSASFDGTNLLIQVTPLNGNSMSWNGSITSV